MNRNNCDNCKATIIRRCNQGGSIDGVYEKELEFEIKKVRSTVNPDGSTIRSNATFIQYVTAHMKNDDNVNQDEKEGDNNSKGKKNITNEDKQPIEDKLSILHKFGDVFSLSYDDVNSGKSPWKSKAKTFTTKNSDLKGAIHLDAENNQVYVAVYGTDWSDLGSILNNVKVFFGKEISETSEFTEAFKTSYQQLIKENKDKIDKDQIEIHIGGHSQGGYVAKNMLNKLIRDEQNKYPFGSLSTYDAPELNEKDAEQQAKVLAKNDVIHLDVEVKDIDGNVIVSNFINDLGYNLVYDNAFIVPLMNESESGFFDSHEIKKIAAQLKKLKVLILCSK